MTAGDVRLGNALRNHRVGLGVSQTAVASASGMSPGTYRLIESGSRPVRVTELLAIAKALRTSCESLLSEAEGAVDDAMRDFYRSTAAMYVIARDMREAYREVKRQVERAPQAHQVEYSESLMTEWTSALANLASVQHACEFIQDQDFVSERVRIESDQKKEENQ